jgi:signal transduction histidine kinase
MFNSQRSVFVYLSLGLGCAAGAIFFALAYPDANAAAGVQKIVIPMGLGIGMVLLLALLAVNAQWQSLNGALSRAETRAAAAEDENRAKSNFLSTISHELRTSLTAIDGYADVLSKRMYGPLGNPKYEEHARNIKSAGETLLNIANDLMQISHMGATQVELTLEPIDVGICTGKVVAALHSSAADKDVLLKLDVLPRPIWGFAQKEALRQALTRIIGNAIKFTPSGGMIVVAVAPGRNQVDITITDNGPGIAPERLKLLAAGKREEAGLAREEGLGLGLVISRRLIERMNGKLIIESIQGRGTRVTLRMQDAESHAAPQIDTGKSGVIERDPFRAEGKQNPFGSAAA